MAEVTINSKMTALADEIRELSGTTLPKSIDAMTTDIDAANSEISEQASLISQITSALEGKAGGGTILPALTTPASASDILSGKEAIDGSGNKITGTITTRTSSNLSVSGATVTVPAGYYASQVTKTISNGSAKTPDTTITKAPSISVNSSGLITASVSGTQSVTPTVTAGYVSSGTAGTITVSGSATKQLTTQAAKTITPSTSSQTAVSSGVYTTGAVTVAAIPSSYIQPSGTKSITSNGTHDVKSYASVDVNVAGGGGGSSVETCTIRIDDFAVTPTYYYTDETMTARELSANFAATITVAKNTIISVSSPFTATGISTSGSITQLNLYACLVTGDGQFVGDPV